LTPAQVRKDLTVFGEFGKQGIGYEVRYLRQELQDILRLNRDIRIGLVGAGSLGTALARYRLAGEKAHSSDHMKVVALFDNDPAKIGQDVEGIPIYPVDELAQKIRELDIKIVVIAVPAAAAQQVADTAVRAGVKTILNFAPARLVVPEDVRVHTSDVTLELQSLAFYTRERDRER
ncbi:MAG: redox-sensing transcriptional repressor Rex, partial [Firmicutes bacterium]|nr:redox-sensing transcriptional repressor Rex [Bacillota bacterium]